MGWSDQENEKYDFFPLSENEYQGNDVEKLTTPPQSPIIPNTPSSSSEESYSETQF